MDYNNLQNNDLKDDESRKNHKGLVIGIILLLFVLVGGFLLFKSITKEYTISIDNNDGKAITSKVVKEGSTIGDIEKPTREGYTFLYWTADGKELKDSDKITKDMNLIAVWSSENAATYEVTFDTDGAGTISKQTIEENNLVIKPEDPKKEGYTFKYWSLDEKEYDFSQKVSRSFELKAVWESNKYTVTFNSDGGSKVASKTVESGKTVSKPANPTRSGYTFNGWTLDGKSYNFNTKVTKNITLVASWKKNSSTTTKKYTVTFNSNGGSKVASKTVESGKIVSKPTNPTRSGYTFNGWTLDGKSYDFNTKVTKNITLVASWKKNSSTTTTKKYTVTFNSNGGSAVASKTVESGKTVSKPANPTRSGYTFNGWLLNGKTYNFNTKVTKNITLTASWKQNTYTVQASMIDSYSPDRVLTVYENGSKITVSAIKYTDGVVLCYGSNTTVSKSELDGVSKLIVVLKDGTQVTATLK